MKTAYFDCFSGISGDMIIGALLDAGLNFLELQQELQKLKLANYEIAAQKVTKNHIAATKFEVIDKEKSVYRHLKDLRRVIEGADYPQDVKETVNQIFLKIAENEAKIHNQPLEKVHFHEISAIDTIIDVTGVVLGLRLLGIEQVLASPLNLGSGFVEFSHGRLPVPAPATAEILKGVPVYSSGIEGELVTPTGAAVITTLSSGFGPIPAMTVATIGYGAGSMELAQPNVLRVLIGDSGAHAGQESGQISIVETNIDDMNPQFFEHLIDTLLQQGALDVYLTHTMMKKNRPGVQLTVLCRPDDESKIVATVFSESTSIGVRIRQERRAVLQREIKEIATSLGPVRFKIARQGAQILNVAPEYEDCRRIAKERRLPLKEVYRLVQQEGSKLMG